MGRTQGAVDRVPRKRSCETAEQKTAKATKKQKQSQNKNKKAKQAFVASLPRVPVSANAANNGDLSITQRGDVNEEPRLREASGTNHDATSSNRQAGEPPSLVETATTQTSNADRGASPTDAGAYPSDDEAQAVNYDDFECEGQMDLGNIVANMDDTWNESNDQQSVMATYLLAILVRIRSDVQEAVAQKQILIPYLNEHGWWIRKEYAETLCKKLKIPFSHAAYYRDIKVWMPDLQYGVSKGQPLCPACKSGMGVHSYPTDHPARRIVGFGSHYFVMSRQYKCCKCQTTNKEQAKHGVGKSERVQYTFMGWQPDVMASYPLDVRNTFPAVLSKRAGLDRDLSRSLRPFFDKGFRAEALSALLLELHSVNYMHELIAYEDTLRRDNGMAHFRPNRDRSMFSKFDDKFRFNGGVPTAEYLRNCHKEICDDIRPHLDRERRKISCDQLSVDGSYKAPKHLARFNGVKLYNTLITITNEHGMIRCQFFAGSESHEQMKGPLMAFHSTNQAYGYPGPRLVFCDNPTQQKQLFLDTLPSVSAEQKRLDNLADSVNLALAKGPGELQITLTLDDVERLDEGQHLRESQCPTTLVGVETQTVSSNMIANKLRSLAEALCSDGTNTVFALDCEWDTIQGQNAIRKDGLVALMQLAYRQDGKMNAMLLQLPRTKADANALREIRTFLTNRNATFIGVRVKSDLDLIGKDFFDQNNLSKDVRFVDLSIFARNRDMVPRGNASMKDVVQAVLNETLDKSESIRCSKWSKKELSDEQKKYAVLDVIKPLEVYEKLLPMPDLSLRLNPDEATPGLVVDVVPPGGSGKKPQRGYRIADMTTRGAVGRILDTQTATMQPGMLPNKVKIISGKSVLVEVTAVQGQNLVVPKFTSNGTKVCLRDFGEPPFTILVPLAMLKHHVESDCVRPYQQHLVSRRITLPVPEQNKESSENELLTDVEAVQDVAEGGLTEEDLLGLGRGGDIDDDDDEGVDLGPANPESVTEQLELVRQAELVAEQAEKGQLHLLFHRNLNDVPDSIPMKWSAVLGDGFHLLSRVKVPEKHEFKKAYKISFMKALYAYDEPKLQEVISMLKSNGWTDREIESTLYFRPGFFSKRVERTCLPNRHLYFRVRAVIVTFASKLDSKTGRSLFNDEAFKQWNNILNEILLGYYSDPPGHNFYSFDLDSEGAPKVDKYGLKIIRSTRGTSDVENVHRQYATTFDNVAGVELASALLDERALRHNIHVQKSRVANYPRFGCYDTWLIDKAQNLFRQNHGVQLFPGWSNASDYRDTDESFVTVALHSEALHNALVTRATKIPMSVLQGYSGDKLFLCKSNGVPVPFLPVCRAAEYKLFTRLMLAPSTTKFDADHFALRWIESVDGVEIFPKHPHHLRNYHKRWERNRRVHQAVAGMKPELEALDRVNKIHTPSDLILAPSGGANATTALADIDDGNDVTVGESDVSQMILPETTPPAHDTPMARDPGLTAIARRPTPLSFFQARASLPPSLLLPGQHALRPFGELDLMTIQGVSLGDPLEFFAAPSSRPKLQGKRGPDMAVRARKTCKICKSKGLSDEIARTCPGRGDRKRCKSGSAPTLE
jgi:3'-5' exonuclease